MENLILGNGEMDKLQSKEENIIKCALGLSTRLSSTDLMICLGINRLEFKIDTVIPSFFGRIMENEYTDSVIDELKKMKLSKNSVVNHILCKFKTKNRDKLIELCKHHKTVIDKNFEYEKDVIRNNSILPALIKNVKANLGEIIDYLRVF